MPDERDIAANRRETKWTQGELACRMAWRLASPFFHLSPRQLWGWRRFLLRCFGAQIGNEVHVYPSVRVAIPWNLKIGDYSAVGDDARLYSLGAITIGSRVTVSQGAHLCAGTHDWRDPSMPLLKIPIQIGDDAWICADAYVGPGATIGAGAIVGARAVAIKDVTAGTIVAGNPAREIGHRER